MNTGAALDMDRSGPIPWPLDSVIIVAARAGTENRASMEGIHPATCRLCEAVLHADTKTVRTAEHLPERRGRPVHFFCVECALQHERGLIELVVDQRGGRDVQIRKQSQ